MKAGIEAIQSASHAPKRKRRARRTRGPTEGPRIFQRPIAAATRIQSRGSMNAEADRDHEKKNGGAKRGTIEGRSTAAGGYGRKCGGARSSHHPDRSPTVSLLEIGRPPELRSTHASPRHPVLAHCGRVWHPAGPHHDCTSPGANPHITFASIAYLLLAFWHVLGPVGCVLHPTPVHHVRASLGANAHVTFASMPYMSLAFWHEFP